jgi:hypothetical protein
MAEREDNLDEGQMRCAVACVLQMILPRWEVEDELQQMRSSGYVSNVKRQIKGSSSKNHHH